jgi:methyl-accepting chemotaxis protein
VPKISYVKLYPASGWVVGAGVYVDDVESALSRSRNFAFIVTGLDLLASFLLSYFMARSLSGPVRRATANLTQFTEESAIAVDHISSASQTIAAGMSQQAASLEETSAALNELTAHTKRSFASAQNMQGLAGRVNLVVEDGNRHMEAMDGAIRQIGDSAQQVRRIVKTIEEIAFQTNILALNAAVEAARAGEAGAGFSVVADEVRNLAQRASQAAKETSDLIGNSLSSSQQGAAISSKLAAAFGDIVVQIQEVSSGLGQITDSFQAETEGIAQVNSAITQISSVTQAQASTSEETASGAEELRA